MIVIDDRAGFTILEVLVTVVIGFVLMAIVYITFLFAWREVHQWHKREIALVREHRAMDAIKWDIWRSETTQIDYESILFVVKDEHYRFYREDGNWMRNSKRIYPDSLLRIDELRIGDSDRYGIQGIRVAVLDEQSNVLRSTVVFPRRPLSWNKIR